MCGRDGSLQRAAMTAGGGGCDGSWRQSCDGGQQGAATAARDAAATVARGASATAAYKGPRRRLEVGAATAAGGLTAVDQGGRD
jgi:hypothetical protein